MVSPLQTRGVPSSAGERRTRDVDILDLAPNIMEDAHERWRRRSCGSHCMCEECQYRRALRCADRPLERNVVDRTSAAYREAFLAADAIVNDEERAWRLRIVDHVARELLQGRAIQ